MRPVLYDLFGIPISSFGIFLLLAFFIAIAITQREARTRLGLDANQVLDLSLYAIIAGIITGRFGYVLINLGQFLTDPMKMLTIWRDGGLVFYGALLGALWLARAFAHRWNVSFGALLDAYAPGMVVGYGIAMVGALLHGLFAGRATGVPWAVELFLERRHPAQVYLLVACVAILGILRAQRHRSLASGTLFVLALCLLSAARFVVDFFVDAPMLVRFLTAGQIASAAVVVITAVALVRLQQLAPPVEPDPIAEVPA